jgi:hypothetical protein
MVITVSKSINIDGLHDVLVDALENKRYTDTQIEKAFHLLPEHIQHIAFQWGSSDTVFRDEAYVYIMKNKKIFQEAL